MQHPLFNSCFVWGVFCTVGSYFKSRKNSGVCGEMLKVGVKILPSSDTHFIPAVYVDCKGKNCHFTIY